MFTMMSLDKPKQYLKSVVRTFLFKTIPQKWLIIDSDILMHFPDIPILASIADNRRFLTMVDVIYYDVQLERENHFTRFISQDTYPIMEDLQDDGINWVINFLDQQGHKQIIETTLSIQEVRNGKVITCISLTV